MVRTLTLLVFLSLLSNEALAKSLTVPPVSSSVWYGNLLPVFSETIENFDVEKFVGLWKLEGDCPQFPTINITSENNSIKIQLKRYEAQSAPITVEIPKMDAPKISKSQYTNSNAGASGNLKATVNVAAAGSINKNRIFYNDLSVQDIQSDPKAGTPAVKAGMFELTKDNKLVWSRIFLIHSFERPDSDRGIYATTVRCSYTK